MNFIIQYVDGVSTFTPSLREEINGRDLSEVVYDLYTKMYVQDFQLPAFKRKWHAAVVGGNDCAIRTERGGSREAFNFMITIHGESQFTQWAVVDGNELFFIYPNRELWVKHRVSQTYQTRDIRAML